VTVNVSMAYVVIHGTS